MVFVNIDCVGPLGQCGRVDSRVERGEAVQERGSCVHQPCRSVSVSIRGLRNASMPYCFLMLMQKMIMMLRLDSLYFAVALESTGAADGGSLFDFLLSGVIIISLQIIEYVDDSTDVTYTVTRDAAAGFVCH